MGPDVTDRPALALPRRMGPSGRTARALYPQVQRHHAIWQQEVEDRPCACLRLLRLRAAGVNRHGIRIVSARLRDRGIMSNGK